MRVKTIDRFNQSNTPFLNEFQEVMLEIVNLEYEGIATKKRINRLKRNMLNRPPDCINTKVKRGILLSCIIEPEIYLLVQETCKKVKNSLMPMDELLHMLLTCFILTYQKSPKAVIPFKHIRKGLRFTNLSKFHDRFSPYYKNISTSLK